MLEETSVSMLCEVFVFNNLVNAWSLFYLSMVSIRSPLGPIRTLMAVGNELY